MNNYQKPEVCDIGRAQDVVLGKGEGELDSIVNQTPSADIDESDE
jgi:hypothetical protein